MAQKTMSKLSTMDLEAEIARRDRDAQKLARKRDRLLDQVAEIDAELDLLGFTVSGSAGKRAGRRGTGKRPKNELPLTDVLQKVLKNKTLGVSQAADAVQKAGYKTSSANFRNIINQTLLKHPKLFKKVERGQYTAK